MEQPENHDSIAGLFSGETSSRAKQYKRYSAVRQANMQSFFGRPKSTVHNRRRRLLRQPLLPVQSRADLNRTDLDGNAEHEDVAATDELATFSTPRLDVTEENDTAAADELARLHTEFHHVIEENESSESNNPRAEGNQETDEELQDQENDRTDAFDSNNRPIYRHAKCTKGQLTSLIMAFVLKHCLTKSCMINLIAILQYMVPGCIPKSKYFFEKLFFRSDKDVFKHFYCPRCSTYLGKRKKSWFCPNCTTRIGVKTCLKKNSFMLVCPIEGQLRDLLENSNLYSQIVRGKQRSLVNSNYYSEITSGHCYKTAEMRSFMQQEGNFSLTFSTDGVQIHKSSKLTVWPIYLTVNEAGFKNKQQNVILHSLYFGTKKPNPDTLLEPLVKEIRRLSLIGFKWKEKSTGRVLCSKIAFPLCVADAPARAMLQNFKQYNGEFGCNYCLHKGIAVQKGRGYARVYPLAYPLPEKRTHESSFESAVIATNQNKAHNGVKGPSYLHLIPNFDIVTGMVPDSMHGIYLGVVKQFMELWTSKTNSKREYYVSSEALDQQMLQIKPPSQIMRLPRSYNLFGKQWKASEYRNFLLFYSSPILKSLLKAEYYSHWLLLVNGALKILQKQISETDVTSAHLLFMKFIHLTRKLYGVEHVTYNVHLLMHIAENVKVCGAPWSSSAFLYEDAGGLMKYLFHGSKAVALQIFSNIIARKRLRDFSKKYISASNDCLLKLYQRLDKTALTFTYQLKPIGIGKHYQVMLTNSEIIDIETCVRRSNNCSTAFSFQRMNFQSKLFSTSNYCSKFKRDDSLVETTGGIYLKIEKILEISTNCNCGAIDSVCNFIQGTGSFILIGKQLRTTAFPTNYDDYTKQDLTGFLRLVIEEEGDMILNPNQICNKCVQIPYSNSDIAIASLTSQFELD